MIYDFTKGKSAIYFSKLISIDYSFDLTEFILSMKDLQSDEIGYFNRNNSNGLNRLGIFLPEYHDKLYKKNPVIHVYNCNTTDDLSKKMKVTNSSNNSFYSKDQNKSVTQNLQVCKKCLRNLNKNYKLKLGLNTFNYFVLSLEENNRTRQTVLDNNGYIINWNQVSYCYREIKQFKCEKCNFTASNESQYKFLHTHHKDRNKLNNIRSNFQCLCVECHSTIDDYHIEIFKFEGLAALIEFKNFKSKK